MMIRNALATLFVALPLSAMASQTGSMGGRVTGSDGTAIPGATITIEGKNQIGKRTEKSDEKGEWRFVEVSPGPYVVSIESTGFLAKQVTEVQVNIGRNSVVDVVLIVPEAAGQEITITDTRPTIDVESAVGGEVVNKEFLTKLPIGTDYLNVARMVPGVIGTGNPNSQGAADSENMFLVDGVNITDPVTNTFSANFNFESIEQVEVMTGGFDPELQALGAVINVVTKSGGNDFEGVIAETFSDNQWSPRRGHSCAKYQEGYVPTGNDLEDEENCIDLVEISERGSRSSLNVTNFALGGPIVRDKAWFFASYGYNQSLNKRSGAAGPRNFTGHYFQSKITYQPDPRHKLTFSFQSDPTLITRLRQSRFVPNEAEAQQAQGGLLFSTEHQWFTTDRLVARNTLMFKNDYIDVTPVGRNLGFLSFFDPMLGNDEVYGDLNTPGRVGVGFADSSVNWVYASFNRRDRFGWSPKITYYADDLLGSHEFAVGGELAYIREHFFFTYLGGIYHLDYAPNPAASPQHYATWETTGPIRQDTSGIQSSIYLQDAWKPSFANDRLMIRGGFRYDRASLYNDEGKEVLGLWDISPRLYFAYDATGDNKTKIFGGYGRFLDPGKLSTSDFLNRHGVGTRLYLGDYFGVQGNGAGSMYLTSTGESSTIRARNVRMPSTDAVRFGFERDIAGGIAGGLTWNSRWTRHLFEDDDANLIWNDDGSQVIGNRQGVLDNRWRIRTPSHARRYYQNIEMTLRRRFADQLEVLGSYTWSRSTGTTEDQYTEALDNPEQNKYDYGYLSNDHTHAVRLSTTYDFNFGLSVGSFVSYLSGTRFERYYYNDYYGAFANRGANRLTGGRIQGAPLWDMKLTYGPKLAARYGKLKGTFTVYNLLNNRQVADIQQFPLDDRGVQHPAIRQRPMTFEVGGRYEF